MNIAIALLELLTALLEYLNHSCQIARKGHVPPPPSGSTTAYHNYTIGTRDVNFNLLASLKAMGKVVNQPDVAYLEAA